MLKLDFKRIKGFTLIEILVSTIILAIGLLGVASMQTLALKDNQDAFFSTQAASLAYEMSDRIAANAAEWQKPTIPTPLASCNSTDTVVVKCTTIAGCTPTEMAAYDYCIWKKNVISRIGPTATAYVNISPSGTGVCAMGNAQRRCVTITWDRNKKLGTQATSSFELEMTP